MMYGKRKPTYAQARALQKGQSVARTNQRRRAAEATVSTSSEQFEHEHRFGDWTCRNEPNRPMISFGYEQRYCECGAYQARLAKL